MSGASRTIVLAAGGTGGHLFPAQALAEQLTSRGHRLALVTDGRGAGFGDALARIEHHVVRSGTPSGAPWSGKIRGLYEIVAGILEARALLPRLLPHAVIGFGGYPSLPTMLAATRLGIPAAIHEQNAVLGRVNRLLARRVAVIALSHRSTDLVPDGALALREVTGNPVRGGFAGARARPYTAPADDGRLRLLILGGSQGARVFSDVVPAAIAMLGQDLRARLDVVQQCRAEDLERVEAHYRSIGVAADLASYFADVPVRLAAAHLVIGRSGASTVAEVAAVGRPALFVPYRHATDDHQFANARGLAEAGGAWIERETKLTAVGLAARLASIMAAPGMLAGMAAAARTQGVADAASRLADLAEALAGHNGDRRARAMPTEKAA